MSNKHVLSSQSVKILEDLVTVIMQAEHRTILGDFLPGDMAESRGQDKQDANDASTLEPHSDKRWELASSNGSE